MCEKRDEGDGDQKRRGQRNEKCPYGDFELFLQTRHAGFDLDEYQRQKDHRGRQAGRCYGAHRAAESLPHCRIGRRAPVEGALHRLEYDDAVVDEQPYREREAEQRQQVQGVSEQVKNGEGGQQADRYCDSDDGDGLPLPQEQVQNDERDAESGQPEAGEASDLVLDLFGGVGADHEFQPHSADFGVQFRCARAKVMAEADQVGPLLLVDGDADGGLSIDTKKGPFDADTKVEVSHVAQLRGFPGGDSRLFEAVYAGGTTVEDHIGDAVGGLEVADVTQVTDVAPHRAGDFVEGHAKGHGPGRIDGQCHLSRRAAGGDGLRDPGHGREAWRDQLFRDVEKRVAVDIATEHIDHHDEGAPVGRVGAAHAQRCTLGLFALDRRCDAAQFEFSDPDIDAPFKEHLEAAARAPDRCARLQHHRQRCHPRLERQQDFPFHGFGLAAGPREIDP